MSEEFAIQAFTNLVGEAIYLAVMMFWLRREIALSNFMLDKYFGSEPATPPPLDTYDHRK